MKTTFILCVLFLLTSQLALAGDNSLLLAVNKNSDYLSVLDLKQGLEIKKIPTGQGPHEVAVSPDGKFATVTNYGYGCAEGQSGKSLTVVNLLDYSTRNVSLGAFRSPHGIVAFKDNIHVAVTVECSRALLIVNIHTGEITQAIDTDADASHMVILSADEKIAFVSNISSGSVSVLDLTAGKLIKTIITGKGAEGIALSNDGKQVWVTNRGVNSISIIDVKSLTVSKTLKTEEFPIRLKFNPKNQQVLISNAVSATVSIFDFNSHKSLASINMTESINAKKAGIFETGPVPIGIVISKNGKMAYVANTNTNEIREINLINNKVTRIFKAGEKPDGLALLE